MPCAKEARWPDELKARLRQLFADGKTAAESALELGKTRNAIIGQWTRLGLAGQRMPANRFSPVNIRERRKRIRPMKQEAKPETNPIEPDHAARCSILQLTEHTCRWPIGDVGHPSFCYCGMPTEEQPYCGHHRLRSYSPRQGRGQDANSAN